MNIQVKRELMDEFKREKEASDAKVEEFLKTLPDNRVDDFNYMRQKHHHQKRPAENGSTDDEPAAKKKKILKVKIE